MFTGGFCTRTDHGRARLPSATSHPSSTSLARSACRTSSTVCATTGSITDHCQPTEPASASAPTGTSPSSADAGQPHRTRCRARGRVLDRFRADGWRVVEIEPWPEADAAPATLEAVHDGVDVVPRLLLADGGADGTVLLRHPDSWSGPGRFTYLTVNRGQSAPTRERRVTRPGAESRAGRLRAAVGACRPVSCWS